VASLASAARIPDCFLTWIIAATTDWIVAIATAVGAPLAAVGVIVAAVQLRGQRRATEAQLVLELDELFKAHDKTHRKFRPGEVEATDDVGRWWGKNAEGPDSAQDWADVEAYMGLFERVSRMIEDGLIKEKTFNVLYGYRIKNILSNQRVVQKKLVERGEYWEHFIDLARRSGYQVPPSRGR
jgi:hypothetical protein